MIPRLLLRRLLSFVCLVGIPLALLLSPHLSPFSGAVHATGTLAPSPLVSRNVPAYTNDDCYGSYPASKANNSNYNDFWRTCNSEPSANNPKWLAYDLSDARTASGSPLGQVVVAWYNDPMSGDYDTSYNQDTYNVPSAYTINVNAAPGGTAPPISGWVTLVSVTSNVYHSRQHIIDMTGYNWVRFTASASNGGPGNSDIAVNMDVHDANQGLQDDWIMFGDSITAATLSHGGGGVGSFAQLMNAGNPAYFPVQEDGGIGYLTSTSGAQDVPGWLSMFPGRFVGLDFGTNDALGGCSQTALTNFYNNYATMVQAVLTAGKMPVVPTIPWGSQSALQACVPSYNAQLQALEQNYPQIIPGPDLYAFFQNNPSLISADGIHPTEAGDGAERQQWATAMLVSAYATAGTPTATNMPDPSATPTSTSVPTDTATPPPTNTPVPPTPTATSTPTDTPVMPTSTATATSTPTATSTATATPAGSAGQITTVGTTHTRFPGLAGKTAVSLTTPAGVQAGDVLIATFGVNATSGGTWTLPSGWTNAHVNLVDAEPLTVFYHVAGTSEPGSYSFMYFDFMDGSGGIIALRGVDATTPILGVSSDWGTGDNTSTFTANSVSWTGAANAASLIVTTWQSDPATITWPSSWDQSPDGFVDNDGYEWAAVGGNLATQAGVTSLPAQTLHLSSSEYAETNQVALKVAGS